MSEIPDDIVKAADRVALDSLGRGYPATVSIIARALLSERQSIASVLDGTCVVVPVSSLKWLRDFVSERAPATAEVDDWDTAISILNDSIAARPK